MRDGIITGLALIGATLVVCLIGLALAIVSGEVIVWILKWVGLDYDFVMFRTIWIIAVIVPCIHIGTKSE